MAGGGALMFVEWPDDVRVSSLLKLLRIERPPSVVPLGPPSTGLDLWLYLWLHFKEAKPDLDSIFNLHFTFAVAKTV